jgi:hypothetical protein
MLVGNWKSTNVLINKYVNKFNGLMLWICNRKYCKDTCLKKLKYMYLIIWCQYVENGD